MLPVDKQLAKTISIFDLPSSVKRCSGFTKSDFIRSVSRLEPMNDRNRQLVSLAVNFDVTYGLRNWMKHFNLSELTNNYIQKQKKGK